MKKITNLNVLNEAYDYEHQQVSFSRGVRVKPEGKDLIYISGTASIDEKGKSIHLDDFVNQAWRSFSNVEELLKSEGSSWKDVIKTTIYIRDIGRDYEKFNEVRNEFFKQRNINPYPASVCVQAILCRPELLIEMEAIALVDKSKRSEIWL